MVSGGGWHSGFCAWARTSRGGVEDLGLRASSLEGGFGLTPLIKVVEGRVMVEKAVSVGEQTFVSEEDQNVHQHVVCLLFT